MARLSEVRVAVLSCMTAAIYVHGPHRAECADTSAAISAAWKARQEKVHSFFFEWDEDLTVGRDALGPALRATNPQLAADQPVPPDDITLPARCSVLIAGGTGRYAEDRQQWSPSDNKVITQKRTIVCRGNEQRELATHSELDYPVGTVAKDSTVKDIFAQAGVLPIALCYRVLDPGFNVFRASGMALRETVRDAEGGNLAIVSFHHGQGRVDLWLDSDRDYIPIRYSVQNSAAKTVSEAEITYQADPVAGWAPASWLERDFDSNGAPTFVRHARLIRAMFNDAVEADDRELAFPLGTWVADKTGKYSYVILPNGQNRVIQPNESRADYARIVAEDDGSVGGWLLLAALGILGGLAVLWMCYRTVCREGPAK